MNRILTILIAIVTLASCDPIFTGELRNYTDGELEVTVCGSNLYEVNFDKSAIETASTEEPKNCKTVILGKGKTLRLVSASEIMKPITSNDLGFDEIVIKTQDGQIQVSGKETIMSLFRIEKGRGILGIHTHDVYHIDVGQEREE